MAQTRREIQALLESAGIRPLKRFGQNFLIDANLLGKLVGAAQPGPADAVLEVGPGTGVLTERLVELSGAVIAVEIDRGMQRICADRFGADPRFTLIGEDILARKTQINPRVLEALTAAGERLGGRMMLVANLPYQVATPLIVELVLGELRVSPLCFTVQAEVADRLLAAPGGKDYGPVSILVQARASGRRIARVPPESFWPSPTVMSAMVKLERGEPYGHLSTEVIASLGDVVHACFNHRRKTMHSNLRERMSSERIAGLAAAGGWRPEDRPEVLSVEQWVRLARALIGQGQ